MDSGSSPAIAAELRALCARYPRCRLVVDPLPDEPFAPGATRNLGAEAATGSHLFFYDVDLLPGLALMDGLLRWQRETTDPREFLVVPCLYLTEAATRTLERAGARPGTTDLAPFLASFLAGDNDQVGHLAASTSTVLVERHHFLRLGGNRTEYRGHGCEDFDLLHRLSSFSPSGRRPADYYLDHKVPFVADYRGFRAYFALRALPPLFEGLYTAHLWHPRPLLRPYHRAREANERRLQELMREHDATRGADAIATAELDEREPLPAPWAGEGAAPAPRIDELLAELMARHGLDRATHPGLFHWNAHAHRPRGTPWTKLRKLVLHPRAFLGDSRLRALRWLGQRLPER